MIQYISEIEFNKSTNIPILFGNPKIDTRFGLVSYDDNKAKFSWSSELVTPEVKELSNNFISIGIDQNYIIYNFYNNNVVLKLALDYFFYYSKVLDFIIYVITELEVIKIDILKYSVIDKIILPDIIENIEFEHEILKITCFNGDKVIWK